MNFIGIIVYKTCLYSILIWRTFVMNIDEYRVHVRKKRQALMLIKFNTSVSNNFNHITEANDRETSKVGR